MFWLSGANGDKPAAIRSAFRNSVQRTWFGRNRFANVVFPAPFGPAITKILGGSLAEVTGKNSILILWKSQGTQADASVPTCITLNEANLTTILTLRTNGINRVSCLNDPVVSLRSIVG